MNLYCNSSILYRLLIAPDFSLEEGWAILENKGVEILYSSEEEGKIEFFVRLPPTDSYHLFDSFRWIISSTPYTLPPIDWEAQWAIHGHQFHDGYVHIDLTTLGNFDYSENVVSSTEPIKQLRLKPGAGFGDLSHPTTQLMMKMLLHHFHGQIVIDIGCGSGILALTAGAMNGTEIYGIDIDPQAIEHSSQNAAINHLEERCHFSHPDHFKWELREEPLLLLMNMIRSEQQVAWNSLPLLHHQPAELITSGLRVEERSLYLEEMKKIGWEAIEEQENEGWLAFRFIRFRIDDLNCTYSK